MSNAIFDQLVTDLAAMFGAFHPLESGTGVRFQSANKGKLTIYHRNIALGNAAEIAFEVESIATRMKLGERETRLWLQKLAATSGRPVNLHPRYQWPRVGIASAQDIEAVVQAMRAQLS